MQKIVSQNPEVGFYNEAMRQAYSNRADYDEKVRVEDLPEQVQASLQAEAGKMFSRAAFYLVAHRYCRTLYDAMLFLDSDRGQSLFNLLTRFTRDGDLNNVPESVLASYLPQKPTRRIRNSNNQHGLLQECLAL
jgi:hypothetical protein